MTVRIGAMLLGLGGLTAAESWQGFAPLGADLVFAAPSEAGTGGMFGHVLLRLRGEHGDVAVGYMAELGDDGMLAMAWKGLFGGYEATYDITPWHGQMRSYQRDEGRPVWIYPLRLDPGGLTRLLERIADYQGHTGDYHLLADNCAGGIADLLDAAASGAGVRAAAGRWSSPGGVLRAAHASGLLEAGSRAEGPGSDRFDPLDDRPVRRLCAGGGYDGEEPYASLALRPAWHTVGDPRGSIALGDTLEVLSAEARWLADSGRAVLQQATILAVQGCAQRGERIAGRAWRGALEARRELIGPDGRGDLQAALSGGFGVGLNTHQDLTAWILAVGDLRLIDDGAQTAAGGGAEFGAHGGGRNLSVDLRMRWLAWDGQLDRREAEARGGVTQALGQRDALRGEASWREAWGWHGTAFSLHWLRYF